MSSSTARHHDFLTSRVSGILSLAEGRGLGGDLPMLRRLSSRARRTPRDQIHLEDRHQAEGARAKRQHPPPGEAPPPRPGGRPADQFNRAHFRRPVRKEQGVEPRGRNPLQDREGLVVDRLDRGQPDGGEGCSPAGISPGSVPRGFRWYSRTRLEPGGADQPHPPQFAKMVGKLEKAHQASSSEGAGRHKDHQKKRTDPEGQGFGHFYWLVPSFEPIGKERIIQPADTQGGSWKKCGDLGFVASEADRPSLRNKPWALFDGLACMGAVQRGRPPGGGGPGGGGGAGGEWGSGRDRAAQSEKLMFHWQPRARPSGLLKAQPRFCQKVDRA